MSDLAYNLNGEPFEVPGAAVGWRVRKLKAKGDLGLAANIANLFDIPKA